MKDTSKVGWTNQIISNQAITVELFAHWSHKSIALGGEGD